MIYVVNQTGVENPIKRNCKYLTVYDGEDKMYNIKVNKMGGLEISTLQGDLKVVCKTSNTLIADVDE